MLLDKRIGKHASRSADYWSIVESVYDNVKEIGNGVLPTKFAPKMNVMYSRLSTVTKKFITIGGICEAKTGWKENMPPKQYHLQDLPNVSYSKRTAPNGSLPDEPTLRLL